MLEKLLQNIKDENVGIITNYFSKQFLNRVYNIFEVPKDNFINYIKMNNLSTLFIDNEIYESDHIWYKREINGLLAHAKLKNIKIIIIRNTEKKLQNTYLDYSYIEIQTTNRSMSEDNKVSIPVLIDEKKYNPSHSVKTIDVLYIKRGKLLRTINIQEYHANIKPIKEEIVFEALSRKVLFNILDKIKKAKCVYVYDIDEWDKVLLQFIEVFSVSQNTVILGESEKYLSDYSIINNDVVTVNNILLFNDDEHYRDRTLIPIQRKALYENSFSLRDSLICNKLSYPEISVITSTNRKYNLDDYIKRMNAQKNVNLQVILVTHGFSLSEIEKESIYQNSENMKVEIYEADSDLPLGYCLNLAIEKIDYDYVAKVDDDDYYFENYLFDSWLAAKYSDADLVGKYSTYTYFKSRELVIRKHLNTHRKYHNFVMGATFFAKSSLMKKYQFSYLATGEDSDFLRRINEDNVKIYTDHPYNFCIFRSGDVDNHTWKISDLEYMRNAQIIHINEPSKIISV